MTAAKMPRVLIVIPARLESTRLPRKLLLELHGKPVIYWTVKRVVEAGLADIIVATDSTEIKAVCEVYGFPVELTSNDWINGTERVYEIASQYCDQYDLFMNVQGDEPLLNIEILETMLGSIGQNDSAFKTAVSKISGSPENNPSEVKVALAADGRIRYASRALIPFNRDSQGTHYKIHGVYLYPFSILERFVNSTEGLLESIEKVEQLRCIENDIPLFGVVTPHTSNSVDSSVDFDFYRSLSAEEFGLS